MNYKKLHFKSKEEWLKAKEQTISGSEAAAIVNKSKWLTPDDIFNKFVYHKTKNITENERMRKGTLAEKHIRALFALDDDRFEIKNPPSSGYTMYVRKDKPYISCTPDGFAIEKKTKDKWGIEVKDVELRKREEIDAWEGNVLSDQYYFQDLQYLVTMNDLRGVILVAHLKYFVCRDNEWVLDRAVTKAYFIAREDVLGHVNYLEQKETDFYENNILKRKRPKLVVKI